MRVFLCTLIAVFLLFSQFSYGDELQNDNASKLGLPFEIEGQLTQGALIRGRVKPGTDLRLNGEKIKIHEEGFFVFGFGREAQITHALSYELPDKTTGHISFSVEQRDYDIQKITGIPQKYVSPPASVSNRINNDNKLIGIARSINSNNIGFTQAFILPTHGRISGIYGSQRVFNGEPRRPHYGLDIAAPLGTAVVAPADATVSLVHNDMYFSGGTLIIDHGMGVSSTFIHLSKIHVKEGQKVAKGQRLAEVGATGRVTGPHLDWRINWFKERLDPALLLAN